MSNTLLAILIGATSGVVGGFFGISGAFIIVIALMMLGLVSTANMAAGTTLLVLTPPISFLALLNYWNKGQVNVKLAIPIMISYALAGLLGSRFAQKMSDKSKKLLLAILFVVLAIIMFYTYVNYQEPEKTISDEDSPAFDLSPQIFL